MVTTEDLRWVQLDGTQPFHLTRDGKTSLCNEPLPGDETTRKEQRMRDGLPIPHCPKCFAALVMVTT